MKRTLITLILTMCAAAVVAQSNLQALFSYSTFYLPDQQQPYIETYMQFDAWTLNFEPQAEGSRRATVEITLVVSMGDSVCMAKKYDLRSPAVSSTDGLEFSFIDVQRFSLRNGIYNLHISLHDKASDADTVSLDEKLVINYTNRMPSLSSLQLMAQATPTKQPNITSRNGYDMQPYVSDFFPSEIERLNVYYEIYNIDRETGNKPFMTMVYIEESHTGTRVADVQNVARHKSEKIVPVYTTLDISKLPSGSYNVVVDVRNRDNQTLLYKKLPFFRSNPHVQSAEPSEYSTTFAGKYTNEEALNIYLLSLYPVASDEEKSVAQSLARYPGLEEKQAFLYTFWQRRNPLNPESEWLKYKERVDYVQQHFSYSRMLGIYTDCGRVYLQYGAPDFIRDEKNYVSALRIGSENESMFEHNALNQGDVVTYVPNGTYSGTSQGHVHYLPYQLWRYNKLDDDNPNRVFLFWDEHRSGLYKLLNSNARGEVQEMGWERRLSRGQLGENVLGEVGEQFNRGY